MPPASKTLLSHHFFKNRREQHRVEVSIVTREPVPLDRARPSVAQLPDPIIRRILTFFHDIRPEDLQTVASLSSALYEQARYVQHSNVHIDLDKSRHVLDRLHLVGRLGQFPAIRTLKVSGRKCEQAQEESNEILARLVVVMPAMTGLRHLDWDVGCTRPGALKRATVVPLSTSILAALPAGLRLRTFVFCNETKESHVQARTFLHRLASNQSLCTLSIQVTFIDEQDCVETMRALKKVLLSCPNLTRLPMIDVWYPRGGCNGYGPPQVEGGPYCGLGLVNGEKPPALEELCMRDYPWGLERARHCQGYIAKGYEWDYWAETFDWSRLVRLNDVPYFLASAIAHKLPRLRELVLENQVCAGIDADFLHQVSSPLQLISLSSWNRVDSMPELISRHGTTLRRLKIHEPERGWDNGRHTFATAPDLVHLSKSLPHLEHLVLDITRDDETQEWPYAALDAIAAFPRLRTVELWFPLGMKPPAPAPLLTASSARHLFHYLRERNGNIQRVTLHSGAPLPPAKGFFESLLDLGPSWAMHNSVGFVCDMVHDGESPDSWLSAWCPDLSTHMNAQLPSLIQRAGRELPYPQKLDADGLRLRVALDGPSRCE
ncbi:hypothetical protein QQX98_002879 [Neonectria punicea]|uniref:F-box domain-containing protein n=1 Tax=Neonectria punicea TaxID=979145 RepID=A0ABR1HGS9_9HYPO